MLGVIHAAVLQSVSQHKGMLQTLLDICKKKATSMQLYESKAGRKGALLVSIVHMFLQKCTDVEIVRQIGTKG